MIARTMQEWADFTGCYAAKNKDYDATLVLFEREPWLCDTKWTGGGRYARIVDKRGEFLSDIAEHDWRVLVEPHTEASHE